MMDQTEKTREQLVNELAEARHRIAELEASEADVAAIENAHLFEKSRSRAKEMAALNELGQALTAHLSIEEVLEEARRGAFRLMDITTFTIGLYDLERNKITFPLTDTGSEIDQQIGVISADQGLPGHIIRNRTSVLLKDNVRARQEAMGIPMVGEEPRSWLGVPLIAGDRVLGVVFVQNYTTSHAYDEHDLALLTAIANQTAIALQNAYLFEEKETILTETRSRAKELIVLNELGQALTTRLSVKGVLDETYHQLSRLIDTTNFFIGLYDPGKHEITFPLNVSESEIDEKITVMSADEGLCGYIIRNHTSLLFEEGAQEWEREMGIDAVGVDALSWLGVPLMIGEQALGVMAVQSHTTPHLYGEHERELLTAIAPQTAIALQNARLFEEAHSRAERLEIINHIAQTASATFHPDDLMETVYQEIVYAFRPDAFFIALYDKEADELEFCFHVDEGVRLPLERCPLGGLSSLVITQEKSLIIRDLEREPEYQSTAVLMGTGKHSASWLGVPLLIGEQVLGLINVQSYTPYAYDEEDELLLLTIADQVAVAFQNARLFEETQRRMREAELLHDVSLAAASGVRLEETLQATVEAVAAKFEDVHAGVVLVDREDEVLCVKATTRPSHDAIRDLRIPLDKGIVGWVTQHGEPALVPDVLVDPRYYAAASDTRSELCAPLTVGSQVIGVLNVESPQVDAFTNDDQRLLSTLASNLAVLVERAQLFDNMEQMVADRTRELRESLEERERLQQEIIEAQQLAIRELSTPIIPVMDRIIVMPLIGSIDTLRARDVMRTLLAGIREYRAKVVILDVTGVPIVDSGVANHLNKTIQAARLKGARTIVTGISDAVAETIVDLGMDWSGIETLADLRTGLIVALDSLGIKLTQQRFLKSGRLGEPRKE